MIQISRYSSLDFGSQWKLDFQIQEHYIQRFKPTDAPRVQYVEDSSFPALVYMNINGSITEITPTELTNNDTLSIREFTIDLTGLSGRVHVYFEQEGEIVLSSMFEVTDEVDDTILLEYTHRRNDFDTYFDLDTTFCFRVEGVFLPQEYSFDNETEGFRDQRHKAKELSSYTIEKRKLTIGGGFGVPNWVARLVNNIFSLSNVHVDGIRTIRSNGSAIEISTLHNDYPLYIYKLDLETTEDEEAADIISLLRVVDSKKKVARSTGDSVRTYNILARELGVTDSKMIRELLNIAKISDSAELEVDIPTEAESNKITVKQLREYILSEITETIEELKDLLNWFGMDNSGNIYVKGGKNFYTEGGITAGGPGVGGMGSADAFANLVDVILTNPGTGDLLSFNGSHWVNIKREEIEGGGGSGGGGEVVGGATKMSELSDVMFVGIQNGDLLRYNGVRWVNVPSSTLIPSLDGYATEQWVTGKNYATESYVTQHINSVTANIGSLSAQLSNYLPRTEAASMYISTNGNSSTSGDFVFNLASNSSFKVGKSFTSVVLDSVVSGGWSRGYMVRSTNRENKDDTHGFVFGAYGGKSALHYGYLAYDGQGYDSAVVKIYSDYVTINNNNILHSGNYNSYSPKLDGTGATGSWDIDVLGNAASATKLQTARKLWGQSFDGSGDVTGDPYYSNNTALFFADSNGKNINCMWFDSNNILRIGHRLNENGYSTRISANTIDFATGTGNTNALHIAANKSVRMYGDAVIDGNVYGGNNSDAIIIYNYKDYTLFGYSNISLGRSTYLDGNRVIIRSGGSYVSSMYIDEYRKVGIGTESPTEKLHVKGNVYVEGNIIATGGVTAGGAGSGSGGGGASYGRLDDWGNYNAGNGDVLSAVLGYGLKQRIDAIEESGALSSVTVKVGTTPYQSVGGVVSLPAYPTTLPASDVAAWAKAATKPSYTWSEIGSKPTTLSGYGITDWSIVDTARTDANLMYDAGIYMIKGTTNNIPSASAYGALLMMPYRKASGNTTPDFGTQIFLPNGDDILNANDMFFRTSVTSQWNAWQKVLTDNNYTNYTYSKSSIDTALAGYLPLRGGTLTGGLTLSAGNLIVSNGHTITGWLYPKDDGQTRLGQSTRRWADIQTVLLNGGTPITSLNYNSYSPKLDGTGAMGSWNINAATATDADTLDGLHASSFVQKSISKSYTDLNDVKSTGFYNGYMVTNSPTGNISTIIVNSYSSDWGSQIVHDIPYNTLYARVWQGAGGVMDSTWKQIAFTDSNVASATKLQTARTIWGQSFDGSGDVYGLFRSISDSLGSGGIYHKILAYTTNPYGLCTRLYSNGAASIQAQRESSDRECFHLYLQPFGGSVGIGTTSPTEKLHVVGNVYVEGNIIATGGVTAASASDARLKENVRPLNGAMELINRIGVRKFNYNATALGMDATLVGEHAGYIAQEFERVLPQYTRDMYGCKYLGIQYDKMIPYLTAGLQEVDRKAETLKSVTAAILGVLAARGATEEEKEIITNELNRLKEL